MSETWSLPIVDDGPADPFDPVDDKPVAAAPEGEVAPAELGLDEVRGLLDAYSASAGNLWQRDAFWSAQPPEVRETLRVHGLVPPVSVAVPTDLAVVAPGDPSYAGVMAQADANVKATWHAVMTGAVALDPATRDEIQARIDVAQMFPDTSATRAQALQTAAAMLAEVRSSATVSGPPGRVTSRRERPLSLTQVEVTETDAYGNTSVEVIDVTPPDSLGAPLASPGRPWVGREREVTLEELNEWPMDVKVRFGQEHRDLFEDFKAGYGPRRTREV